MNNTVTALLIGYGYVAEATARRILDAGGQVIATTRSRDTAGAIAAAGGEPLLCDPADEAGGAALREAASRASHVICSVPPGREGDPVLPALEAADLSRCWIGYLSTTGVYGDRRGGWAFEWQTPSPGQTRSIARVEAEAGWAKRGARLFRLSGIYGPGRSALDRLRAGKARRIADANQVFSRVHVADIADCLVRAMDRPDRTGAFNLADDWPCPQREVIEGAAALLGIAPPPLETLEAAQMSEMARSFYAENRRVSNARAKAAFSWRPSYPSWREGLRACLDAEDGDSRS